MASYVVMQAEGGRGGDADDAVFVRDGFAWLAFFVPVLWLLWHRLWIEAAFALAVTVGLTALGNVAGFGLASPLLSLLVSLYMGLEGAALRIAALRRRGWHEFGVVDADSLDAAETRYVIETVGVADDGFDNRDLLPMASASRKADPGPALGFLLNPGKS
ncbi:Protein of unknown function [Mesorhizobium albiziae]|uniref:DUF2628 domain-containing protein n=1 Tax=Neomesorhizobium albiziae TaxID=335020 RepID=A0A1I4BEF1_9HYPH|nr:DUF2628 domain-containing protein [Mesorhizobium albiziae]GLS29796.1 hypothetical protein GCM10007937_15040 [Mesorhizobium albiziae]SFK66660.1 Protein of unknown function [Mesorhizobium albiziae]